jgi:hypothetical protein
MLVVSAHGRVVVPGHSGDASRGERLDHFVGPRGVADQVAEMVHRSYPLPVAYVLEHRPESGKVGVDV